MFRQLLDSFVVLEHVYLEKKYQGPDLSDLIAGSSHVYSHASCFVGL